MLSAEVEDRPLHQLTFGRSFLTPSDQRYEEPLWGNTDLLHALSTRIEVKCLYLGF